MTKRKNIAVYAPPWEIVNRLLKCRESKDENRLVENAEFYCTVFNDYPTGKDDLIARFSVSISHDKRLSQLRFSFKNGSVEWFFSIPVKCIPADTFECVLLGRSTLGELLYEVLNSYEGEMFDEILTADKVEKSFLSWDDYVRQLGVYDEKGLLTFNTEAIRERLNRQNFVWYYGCSCSGKSYMGIRQLDLYKNPRIAYNPCFSAEYEYEIVKLMLFYGENISLLIDDVQCDTEKAKELFSIIAEQKSSFKQRNVFVFLISWTDLLKNEPDKDNYFAQFEGWFDPVEANTSKYLPLLKDKIGNTGLRDICGNNLALLNTARKVVSNKHINDPEKTLFDAFIGTKETDKLLSIYKLCVLGTYAYLVEPKSLQTDISPRDLSTIKIVDGKYYAGHKEICRFLSQYIERNARTLGIEQLPKPDTVVYDYIQGIGMSKQWKAIKQLIDEQGEESLQNVSPIWKGLHRFEQEISSQTQKDPTWKNTPSSMFFVLKAASLLGTFSDYDKATNPDLDKPININPKYKKVISNFCDKFQVTDNRIEVRFEDILTTHDFVLIRERMIEEDKNATAPLPYEYGETIDSTRAHKNWLLGLVVGLASELKQFDRKDLLSVAVNTLFSLQDPSGFWYPKRVPWITARVLIGLYQAGYTDSNSSVKKGVEFLIQSLGEDDHWEAHTGGWNTPYETSSLCLEAIFNNCGRDALGHKQKLNRVVNYLLATKAEWMRDDLVVDGTATACCLLKEGVGEDRDLFGYIQKLCEDRIYSIVEKNPDLNLEEKQSCETTQIAWYIMDYCWYYLSANLSDMLNQFVTRSLRTSEEAMNTMDSKFTIFFSYSEDSESTVNRIQRISAYLRERGYNVKCYADEPVGTSMITFMQDIPNADLILVFGSKSYKEKALTINGRGGGVFFENLVLAQLFIQNNMDKIIPIAFERGISFDESFPPPFGTNKGLRCPRVTENFLKDLAEKIEEKLGGTQNV